MTPTRPLRGSRLPVPLQRALVASAAREPDLTTEDVYLELEAQHRAAGLPLAMGRRDVADLLRAAADRGEIERRGAAWHVPGVVAPPRTQPETPTIVELPMPSPLCSDRQHETLSPIVLRVLRDAHPRGLHISDMARADETLRTCAGSWQVALSIIGGVLVRMRGEGLVQQAVPRGPWRLVEAPRVEHPPEVAPPRAVDAGAPVEPPVEEDGPAELTWVYVGGPLAADDPLEMAWHRERALLLARQLQAEHVRCVVPHVAVAPLYAAPDDLDVGRVRELGLRHSMDLMMLVRAAGGELIMLERDEAGLSAGCEAEWDAWRRRGGGHQRIPWSGVDWMPELREQAKRLEGPPTTLEMARDLLLLVGLDIPREVLAELQPHVVWRAMDAAAAHHALACVEDDGERDLDPPPMPAVLQLIERCSVARAVIDNLAQQVASQTDRIVRMLDTLGRLDLLLQPYRPPGTVHDPDGGHLVEVCRGLQQDNARLRSAAEGPRAPEMTPQDQAVRDLAPAMVIALRGQVHALERLLGVV